MSWQEHSTGVCLQWSVLISDRNNQIHVLFLNATLNFPCVKAWTIAQANFIVHFEILSEAISCLMAVFSFSSECYRIFTLLWGHWCTTRGCSDRVKGSLHLLLITWMWITVTLRECRWLAVSRRWCWSARPHDQLRHFQETSKLSKDLSR